MIGSLQFPSGNLLLEAALYNPDAPASSAVVVCHPHPLRGGNIRNNVVVAAARALQSAGVLALTFNFRGAGASQGEHDNGDGEQDDVRAALAYASSLDGIERVGLAGYSFGAGVALSTAVSGADVMPLALIALPTAADGVPARLETYGGPLLLMTGSDDHVSSAETLLHAAAARPEGRTEAVIAPNVDHFWRGYEPVIGEHVGAFFARHLARL